MATGTSIIVRGLQMLGGKAIGGTLTSDEQTAYLAILNAMLDSWSTERLMCFNLVQESKALTASVGSLTIGSAGTWNTTRPTKIVDPCFVRDSGNIDYPIEIIDARSYGSIRSKTSDGSYPRYLFYDTAFVSALATIYIWPEPASGLTLYINSWKQLTAVAAVGDTLSFPPGYEEAISSNFAVRAAAGWRTVPPGTALIARQSKANLMRLNSTIGTLRMDEGIIGTGRRRDINSDT